MIGSIELSGEPEISPCACCGAMVNRIWGTLFTRSDEVFANYYVTWHPGPSDRPATFDFLVVELDEIDQEEYVVVSLLYHDSPEESGFKLVDGNESYIQEGSAARAYTREEIRDWPEMRQIIVHLCEYVCVNDPRAEAIMNVPADDEN